MEQKVHLAQAQPVPRERLAALERLVLSVQVLLEHLEESGRSVG